MKKAIVVALMVVIGSLCVAQSIQVVDTYPGAEATYMVKNSQIEAHYDCFNTCDAIDVLSQLITSLGTPARVVTNNTELNRDVAIITKKHGVSTAVFQTTGKYNRFYVMNTYDDTHKQFQTYVWYFNALR